MPEPDRPLPFAARAAFDIAIAVGLAFSVLRFTFADSESGWAVVIVAALGCSAVYFALALRRCRAADRRAARVPASRTQPSRCVRSIAPHQGS